MPRRSPTPSALLSAKPRTRTSYKTARLNHSGSVPGGGRADRPVGDSGTGTVIGRNGPSGRTADGASGWRSGDRRGELHRPEQGHREHVGGFPVGVQLQVVELAPVVVG